MYCLPANTSLMERSPRKRLHGRYALPLVSCFVMCTGNIRGTILQLPALQTWKGLSTSKVNIIMYTPCWRGTDPCRRLYGRCLRASHYYSGSQTYRGNAAPQPLLLSSTGPCHLTKSHKSRMVPLQITQEFMRSKMAAPGQTGKRMNRDMSWCPCECATTP